MRIPVLKLKDYLLTTIQVELDDQTVVGFQENLLSKIQETGAKDVVIDLTFIEIVGSYLTKIVGNAVKMAELLVSQAVLNGIHKAVVITTIDLGINLKGVLTALDLEQGLEKLQENLEGK